MTFKDWLWCKLHRVCTKHLKFKDKRGLYSRWLCPTCYEEVQAEAAERQAQYLKKCAVEVDRQEKKLAVILAKSGRP